MSDIIMWIIVIIGMTVPVLVGALFNYFLNKKKVQAETESIKLKNKIAKEITYDQLRSESKHKDIKSKLEIFQRLTKLEEEIKIKENKSVSDQKKLESLEMIKKEFKETFVETKEAPKLVEEEKKSASKKESGREIKKIKPAKPTLKTKARKKTRKEVIISQKEKNSLAS